MQIVLDKPETILYHSVTHSKQERKMWDSQDVIDYFDSQWDSQDVIDYIVMVTLSELSYMSGWSIPDLKSLLMGA